MKTSTFTAPAYWAPALINGDYSGMAARHRTEIWEFFEENKDLKDVVGCADESYIGRWGERNLMTDILEYEYVVREPEHV